MNNQSLDNYISELYKLCQNDSELKNLIFVLKELTNATKSDKIRSQLTHMHWNSFIHTSKVVNKILYKNKFEDLELDFLAEFFRFLRNACAGSVQNQNIIFNTPEIFNCAKKVLTHFKNKRNEKELVVLKICLQLFGNAVCMSNNAKLLVWNFFLEEQIFKYLFELEDYTAKEYAMMVLYNCMSDDAARYLIEASEGHMLLLCLVNSLCADLVDWGLLFLEFILKQEDFMRRCYQILPLQSRLLILDIIIEQLNNVEENSYIFVPYSSIFYIKELFIHYAMNIVHLCGTQTSDMNPIEIVKLLGLLCAASVSDTYSHVLKTSKELLETALDTLKSVHFLGKKSCNAFSCISSLKVTNQISKEEIESNPSFGFKKNLIRLIGNLCYNHKDNQDTVRKLDGIPLLLDCCNLDARNPFIMQWCILAIRNILEKNSENQAVLAGVSVSGDLVDSVLIKELGFEVHSENGKFVLKSINTEN